MRNAETKVTVRVVDATKSTHHNIKKLKTYFSNETKTRQIYK